MCDTDRVPATDRIADAGLATAGIGAAAVAARALSVPLPCPLLALSGIPCPGCGLTRLADGLAHGHVLDAVTADPIGVAVLVVLATLAALALARRVTPTVRMPRPATKVPALLLALLALRWATVLAGVGPTVT